MRIIHRLGFEVLVFENESEARHYFGELLASPEERCGICQFCYETHSRSDFEACLKPARKLIETLAMIP